MKVDNNETVKRYFSVFSFLGVFFAAGPPRAGSYTNVGKSCAQYSLRVGHAQEYDSKDVHRRSCMSGLLCSAHKALRLYFYVCWELLIFYLCDIFPLFVGQINSFMFFY